MNTLMFFAIVAVAAAPLVTVVLILRARNTSESTRARIIHALIRSGALERRKK